MDLGDLLAQRNARIDRLSATSGVIAERTAIREMNWRARPKGAEMSLVLRELEKSGVRIKSTSFDAIAGAQAIDFLDQKQIRRHLPSMVFIEIKSTKNKRVKEGFEGYFFALTENEIHAAEQLGEKYRVALINSLSSEMILTSVPTILRHAKSKNWQLSVQLNSLL